MNFIYPEEHEFVKLPIHGFSNNYMFSFTTRGVVKSRKYHDWREQFDKLDIPNRKYWSGVNWNKPIELFLDFVCKPDMDSHNLVKSAIDGLMTHYHYDDVKVINVYSRTVGGTGSYDKGEIRFFIRNTEKK